MWLRLSHLGVNRSLPVGGASGRKGGDVSGQGVSRCTWRKSQERIREILLEAVLL